MQPKELERVRLKDGRTAVILADYDGVHFCVEIDMPPEDKWNAPVELVCPTIHIDEIADIID